MRLLFGAVLLFLPCVSSLEVRVICQHVSYIMRDGFCYSYIASSATYSQARERCERDKWGSSLLYINSAAEESYIRSDIYEGEEFWLGLNDQLNEGDFRWSHNNSRPIYKNYSTDIEDKNNDNYDCIKFTDTGWTIAENFCENIFFPFVCKAPVCGSRDGVKCDEVRVEESDSGGLSVGALAAIVIVIIVVICVIVVLILLVLLWKYKNDAFRHYVCPCIGRGSKQAMMSLQQENQRLRQELNQTKMNSSNRFSQGHFGRESVSGVPDGMGGMLPALKPGGGVGYVNAEPFLLSSLNKPPPLSLQHGMSRVAPMPPSGGPFLSSPTTVPSVFTTQRSNRQSSTVMKPVGVAMGGVLPPLKESKGEDSDEKDTSVSPHMNIHDDVIFKGKIEEQPQNESPLISDEVKGQVEEVEETES